MEENIMRYFTLLIIWLNALAVTVPAQETTANFNLNTGTVSLPYVDVPNLGVFSVELQLVDNKKFIFKLVSVTPTTLGDVAPSHFDPENTELHIPVVTVGDSFFEAKLVATTAKLSRFRFVTATPTSRDATLSSYKLVPTEDTRLFVTVSELISDSNGWIIDKAYNAINSEVALIDDQRILFTPHPNFAGIASFDYVVRDESGNTKVATAKMQVNAVADPPTLVTHNVIATPGKTIPLDIYAKLTDTDDSEMITMTVSGLPVGATLSSGQINNDGTWTVSLRDASLTPAFNTLIKNADAALQKGPFSVMDKSDIPPSGDKHDYYNRGGGSEWPNPPDGRPWIFIDGSHNPDAAVDKPVFKSMTDSVENLTLAYFFTRNENYANYAAYLLRTWFVDDATRMNPNANHSKHLSGFGLMLFVGQLRKVINAVGILESSPAWTTTDRQGLQQWCRDFLQWLTTSKAGISKKEDDNNHSTGYHALVSLLYLYLDDKTMAKQTVLDYQPRIAKQISPDGSQPFEIVRANSLKYHEYNLRPLLNLATLSDHFDDVDLWGYKGPDGQNIKAALDFLIPYAMGEEWPYFPEEPFEINTGRYYDLFRRAAINFHNPAFEAVTQSILTKNDWHSKRLINLTSPAASLHLLSHEFNGENGERTFLFNLENLKLAQQKLQSDLLDYTDLKIVLPSELQENFTLSITAVSTELMNRDTAQIYDKMRVKFK